MQRLRQLVSPVLARYKLEAGVEAAQAANAWPKVATDVLGASFPIPRALFIKDGVLWLELTSSVVAQEVQLAKVQLLEKLKAAQTTPLTDIRFRAPQSGAPQDSVVGRRG